jgi:hypothetical protein
VPCSHRPVAVEIGCCLENQTTHRAGPHSTKVLSEIRNSLDWLPRHGTLRMQQITS